MNNINLKTARKNELSTKLFNTRLFFEAIKRLRVIGIAVAIFSLTISILVPSIAWISEQHDYERRLNSYYAELDEYESKVHVTTGDPEVEPPEKPEIVASTVNRYLLCLPLYAIPFLAPFFFLVLFSFLHRRKDSDFYHAIPYTRTCVYVSFVSAALAFIFAIQIASALIGGAIFAASPFFTFEFGTLLEILGTTMLAGAFLSSFMMLSLSVTGTGGTTMLLFGLFASITRIVLLLFAACIESIWIVDASFYPFLSASWYLPIRIFVAEGRLRDSVPTYAELIPYTIVVTALIFLLAGVLYKTRRSEMAERSAPSRLMQSIFRCLFTLPFALIITALILTDDIEFEALLILLTVTLLVFYLYELITTKRPKNMLKATPWLGAVIGASLLFAISFGAFSLTVHRSIPVEKINSVAVDLDTNGSYESVLTSNLMTKDERAIAIVQEALEDTIAYYENGYHFGNADIMRRTVSIRKTNGATVNRVVYFVRSDYELLMEYLADSEEFMESYLDLPDVETIVYMTVNTRGTGHYYGQHMQYGKELRQLWEVLEKEYADLSPAEKISFKESNLYSGKYPSLSGDFKNPDASIQHGEPFVAQISVVGNFNGYEYNSTYTIPGTMQETINCLFEIGKNNNYQEYHNEAFNTDQTHIFTTDTYSPVEIGNAFFSDLAEHFTDKSYYYTEATVTVAAYGDYEISLDFAGNEAKYASFFRLMEEYTETATKPREGAKAILFGANVYRCVDSNYSSYSASADFQFILYLTEEEYRALLSAADLSVK